MRACVRVCVPVPVPVLVPLNRTCVVVHFIKIKREEYEKISSFIAPTLPPPPPCSEIELYQLLY